MTAKPSKHVVTGSTLGSRIRDARKARDISQKDIADFLELSVQAVSQWERDIHKPEFDRIVDLSRLLAVVPHWLITGQGSQFYPEAENQAFAYLGIQVPVLDDEEVEIFSNTGAISFTSGSTFLFVDKSRGYPPTAFAYKIEDDANAPLFARGDIVVLDPTLEAMPGDFVIVHYQPEEIIFRKFERAETGIGMRLVATNPEWPSFSIHKKWSGKIIAPMVEHRRYRRVRSPVRTKQD